MRLIRTKLYFMFIRINGGLDVIFQTHNSFILSANYSLYTNIRTVMSRVYEPIR